MIKYLEATQEMIEGWEYAFCVKCEYRADGECGMQEDCFEIHQEEEPDEFAEATQTQVVEECDYDYLFCHDDIFCNHSSL